ncbi:MAG: GTP-binding protein [Candidatus Heimdallarchaeota archaeon]|nr:GTP-binding protein [Candidatus Heimdallarchaeota archaeon]
MNSKDNEKEEEYKPTWMELDNKYVPKKQEKKASSLDELRAKEKIDYVPSWMKVEETSDEKDQPNAQSIISSKNQKPKEDLIDKLVPSQVPKSTQTTYNEQPVEIENEEDKDVLSIKLTLLGDAAVGKTSIRKQYMGSGLGDQFLYTIGVDMNQKKIDLGNTIIEAQIWDIAGQDSLEDITSQFLSGTQGAIIVFDLTRMVTFDNITNWLERLHAENEDAENNIPFVLIGNKADLVHLRKVTTEDVNNYLEFLNRHKQYSITEVLYLEVSAKTGKNINDIFHQLGSNLLENFELQDQLIDDE